MIQRVVIAAAVLVLVGCAYDTELGSSSQASTITDQCRVRGLGLLTDGDFFAGRVTGASAGGDLRGQWIHIIPGEECEPPPPCDDCDGDVDEDCDLDVDEDVDEDFDTDIDEDVDEGIDEDSDDDMDEGVDEGHGRRGRHRGRRRGRRQPTCDPRPDILLLRPERLLCRINGIDIADFDGPAVVNGSGGYTYAINILDQGDPGDPFRDFYTLTVFDASGAVVAFRDGEVVTGDVDVDIP